MSDALHMPAPAPAGSPPPLLQLDGVAKSYAQVRALDGVSLDVRAGEIHAVLGENGAGKSTLMKIIYGAVQPDSGTLCWNGEVRRIASPTQARALGIAMVFQHFALFESITAVENVSLALPGRESLKSLASRLEQASVRYGLPVHPWQDVHHLSVGERQRVEILRCLLQSPRLLIMDEPTSVLTPQAVDQLFETLRQLAAEGTAILYVSHKLEEIRRLCDRATVIRQGRVVATADPRTATDDSLAELMIGRSFPKMQRRPVAASADAAARAPALELCALNAPADGPYGTALRGLNLRLRAGEILGVAGISGNGQAEFLAALSGQSRSARGQIRLAGQAIGHAGPAERRRLGLTMVPEERLGVGAVPTMSLAANALLTGFGEDMLRHGLVSHERARAFAQRCIADFDVRCNGVQAQAGSLSGGNLQKFIVGREVLQEPKVMVLGQPTWGVDVAATALIRQRLIDLAARGVAVLIVSEDLGEILEVCDQVAVMAGGRLSPRRDIHTTDAAEIGRWMAGDFPDPDPDPITTPRPDADRRGAASPIAGRAP